MMIDKEIFALYLPQFHAVPENDQWWGKGYTEWNAVKNAKSYYKGHNQPKVPLNDNYYDLSDRDAKTWKWQAKLAAKYGVDGFAIYHYWFKNGKKLLEKPMEILLEHLEIDIQYFVCWANESWKRTWYQGTGREVLMQQDYGGLEDWDMHYQYLRNFFLDKRYKKIDNRPVIGIYRTSDIEKLYEMKKYWSCLAKKDGFNGVFILGAKTAMEQESRDDLVDAEYMFEPSYTLHYQYNSFYNMKRAFRRSGQFLKRILLRQPTVCDLEDMKELYKCISLPSDCKNRKIFCGICPKWDNTPRKQDNGCVFKNSSPQLFEAKLYEILSNANSGSIIMINAWNEWGEGAYLEPDTFEEYGYLEAIRNAKYKYKKDRQCYL